MVLFYLRHETYADVAELADALDSGSSEAIRVGSSPVTCTTKDLSRDKQFCLGLFSWSGGDLDPKTQAFFGFSDGSEIYSKCAQGIALFHFSLFPSGASVKTVINCFRLAYPSPAPEKSPWALAQGGFSFDR